MAEHETCLLRIKKYKDSIDRADNMSYPVVGRIFLSGHISMDRDRPRPERLLLQRAAIALINRTGVSIT